MLVKDDVNTGYLPAVGMPDPFQGDIPQLFFDVDLPNDFEVIDDEDLPF